jgi:hypothetical protein
VAVPRSEDCLNGRSRCGIEENFIPKRLNGTTNEHDPNHRAGLYNLVKYDVQASFSSKSCLENHSTFMWIEKEDGKKIL